MYPSGTWRGWWEQVFWGRQPMNDFSLHFSGGRVRGGGRDVVGPFTFAGTYDGVGNVSLVKQYTGRHQVEYEGRWDGEGTIFGTWRIAPDWSGPFALSPAGFRVAADAPILTVSVPGPSRGGDE